MLGVSLIIITVVIFYPLVQRDYPQYQKCLDDFTKVHSMDGEIDEIDNKTITTISFAFLSISAQIAFSRSISSAISFCLLAS
jgi:hypothetical protein